MPQIALNRFKNHSLPEISRFLRIKNVKTFDEASKEAIEEERITNATKNKWCSKCRSNSHNTIDCTRKNFVHYPPRNTNVPTTKTCGYCKIQGHVTSEC